uniref:MAK10-like protein n=1 Tax=Tanacetum cinerariifolium TaxID=118510 RepID=A0A6L2KDC8_TANCI|nr:MAK10-like protein [Tanacetum cinerariifolium]
MEAHLAPTQPTQVNKITTSCEIYSGPHDTQYYMEDPKQAFVEYASSRTDEAGRSLPSNTVKNLKLSTSLVLFARSYPKIDLQCSSHPSTSINAIKTFSTEANISQTSQLEIRIGIGTQQPDGPEPTTKDEFPNLHLNLTILEVLAHAPIYNVILDKYMESLELGKNRSAFVQGEVSAKMEDPGLFTLPCNLRDSKPFDTLADLGSKAKIVLGEGITRSVFGVKGVDLGEEEAPYWTTLGKRESYNHALARME